MSLRSDDFTFLANMLKQQSGLIVGEDKVYLLESRLTPLARKFNLNSIEEICTKLRGVGDPKLAEAVVESMTTNESSFFRDTKPFDQFKQVVLPMLLQQNAGKRSIRIWSAASSSGQEAYSLAMILKEEAAKLAGWNIEIIGTDLSKEMVEKSQEGAYTQFEVQRGLPIMLLMKYFKQEGDKWRISDDLKKMVNFRTYNLLSDLSPLGSFDVVFCRNVLIYFDQPTKAKVLDATTRLMPPHGVLFLGGAETVLGITDKFKPMEGQRGLYILSSNGMPAALSAAASLSSVSTTAAPMAVGVR
jgi:chemotaxis protein methyltransferase CheR